MKRISSENQGQWLYNWPVVCKYKVQEEGIRRRSLWKWIVLQLQKMVLKTTDNQEEKSFQNLSFGNFSHPHENDV